MSAGNEKNGSSMQKKDPFRREGISLPMNEDIYILPYQGKNTCRINKILLDGIKLLTYSIQNCIFPSSRFPGRNVPRYS